MIKKLLYFFAAAALQLAACLTASAQLQIGGWQTHFAYNGIDKILQTPDKVYALCNGNLFSVDKQYHSIETYSKLTGLSDAVIKDFAYDQTSNTLVLCYDNLNIDLISGGKTSRITDIAQKDISNKTINSITFNNGRLFLSCGFGIVEINVQKKEIARTYIIGKNSSYKPVLRTIFSGDSIYALTDSHLFIAHKDDKALSDYNHWRTLRLPDATPNDFCIFNGSVHYLGTDWQICNNDVWTPCVYSAMLPPMKSISVEEGKLITICPSNATAPYGSCAIFKNDFSVDTLFASVKLKDVSLCDDNLWLACDSLTIIDHKTNLITNAFRPDGPFFNNVTFFHCDNGRIVSGYGRAWNDQANIQAAVDDDWKNLSYLDIDDPAHRNLFLAVWDARFDPKDPRRLYVATWYGIFEFYDYKFVARFTNEETSLNALPGSIMVPAEKMTFDDEGNLWIINTQASAAVHYRDSRGIWYAIDPTGINGMQRSAEFLITKKDQIKVVVAEMLKGNSTAVCFFKSGSKPYFLSKERTFTNLPISDGSSVSPSRFYCAAEDNNGDVWVGTDVGPFVFKNPANVFDSNYTVTRIKLTRRDDASLADYLLATEQINAIAVDGANRKWIGTASSGLYLISPDGQKTIHHFTTENSPLTTNSISKIGIDDETGLVYIQTSNGLFSFQSDAAEGKDDFSNVHVFPNPVRPDYSGPITVTGLMENTEVRITDAQGHVVNHGKSNGSMYTWDGTLDNGRHASTGIYFVFQTTIDGENSNVAKFAIIKR